MGLTIPQPAELAVEPGIDGKCYDLVLQCKTSIEQAEFPPTLEAATYVVAFRHNSAIRMAGFVDEPSAEAFYQLVSNDRVKILKYQLGSHAGELLASDGAIGSVDR
ncbi:hypothetical protein V5O48_009886 [Marasmius crinis-equi]|uniref:Uncharacterized protein n=1 Tax=Marasmius crinis-equi TaxID=585013 RepID=A0ABR3FA01_9AGAR